MPKAPPPRKSSRNLPQEVSTVYGENRRRNQIHRPNTPGAPATNRWKEKVDYAATYRELAAVTRPAVPARSQALPAALPPCRSPGRYPGRPSGAPARSGSRPRSCSAVTSATTKQGSPPPSPARAACLRPIAWQEGISRLPSAARAPVTTAPAPLPHKPRGHLPVSSLSGTRRDQQQDFLDPKPLHARKPALRPAGRRSVGSRTALRKFRRQG